MGGNATPRPLYPRERRGRAHAEPDGTRAETRFRLSPKRTSPFKSAGESVQSTAGSRGARISVSNAGYITSRGRVRVLATHSICQFPLNFPSRASPCATTFRKQYTTKEGKFHPITCHEDPEREKRYSSTLSSTSALDGGGWSVPHPGRLTLRKETPY